MKMGRFGLDWVIWQLTNKCNLSCSYCFTSSSPRAEKPLGLDELLYIADQINYSNVKLVTIIGGEPFTLDCLPTIIERLLYIKNREINIDTNGTLLRKRWHPIYEKVNRINISLDDINEESNNMQRGGYSSVIDAIDFLRDNKITFGGNITITSRNFERITETAEYLLKNGASIISFSRIKPLGFGKIEYTHVNPSREQEEVIIQKILDFYEKHNKQVKILTSGFYDERLFKQGSTNKLPSCLCGDVKVTIDPYGFVYPCQALPSLFSHEEMKGLFKPSNVLNANLMDIDNDSWMVKWRDLIYSKPNECRECTFQLYCDGGCRALNYFMKKKLDAKDPHCALSQNK